MSNHRPPALRRALAAASALVLLAGCAADPRPRPGAGAFRNLTTLPQDEGDRAGPGYLLRRAWVQLTRDEAATPVPPTLPLDMAAMARQPLAAAWLGHAGVLLRAGCHWVLLDPVFSTHVGPLPPFGPKWLTVRPIELAALPRIDAVLLSHDHFDHLDLPTLRQLRAQPGGPPRFLAGRGTAAWLDAALGLPTEEFDWWQAASLGSLSLRFVPAQHSSGRGVFDRNQRLWGGWVVATDRHRFYFAGDTAFEAGLFQQIAARAGPFDLAALPIGTYLPRPWMRHEHMDPAEAVQAHRLLGAPPAFGIHWASLQLGDEEPITPSRDLAAVPQTGPHRLEAMAVGAIRGVSLPGPMPACP